MSKKQYTAGENVTVGDLEVGDTIFARHDRRTKAPSAPVEVTGLTPSVRDTGLVEVVVQSVYGPQGRWVVGWLATGKTFPRAELVA